MRRTFKVLNVAIARGTSDGRIVAVATVFSSDKIPEMENKLDEVEVR